MHSLYSVLTASALLFLLGCGDFEDYRLGGAADGGAAGNGAGGQPASVDGGPDGPANEPFVASPSKPDPDGQCPSGKKHCGDLCFALDDPSFGCGPTCRPGCPTSSNARAVCRDGVCSLVCATGFQECSPGVCSAPGTFYEDRDKDGFGGPVTTRACSAPPGYVSQGGDCHDGNADVFPGQSKLFTAPYTVAGGGISFDFDCDGKETVDPTASVSRTTSTCIEGSVCNQASNGQDCWVPTTAFGATRCGQGRLICSHPFGWQDRPRVGCR